MSKQHTAGPWSVQRAMTAPNGTTFIDCPNGMIAWMADNNQANARLIAAAPDLLAALQATQSGTLSGDEQDALVRAAIAKATGA